MNALRKILGVSGLACCFVASSLAAEPPVVKDPASAPKSAILARGKYLVTLGGCHDCHTPKLMTEKGPAHEGGSWKRVTWPPFWGQSDEGIFAAEVRTDCKPRANNSHFRGEIRVSQGRG
jgi:hypothetical protein